MENENIIAFVIPKNIEDLPLAQSPNLVGNFVVEENKKAKRLPSDVLMKIINTGISGDLDKVTAEEIPTTGYYKYDIFTEKTYTNVTPNITVDPGELDEYYLYGVVLNGVAYKAKYPKPNSKTVTWEAKAYPFETQVFHNEKTWEALRATLATEEPGKSDAWIVKSGGGTSGIEGSYPASIIKSNPFYYNPLNSDGVKQVPLVGTGDINLSGEFIASSEGAYDGSKSVFFGNAGTGAVNLDLGGANDLLIEFWFKPAYNSDTNSTVLQLGTGISQVGAFSIFPLASSDKGGCWYVGSSQVSDTRYARSYTYHDWVHMAFRITNKGLLYCIINGQKIIPTGSGTGEGDTSVFVNGVLHLMSGNGAYFMRGNMQDLAIYKANIPSDDDILNHYNARFRTSEVIANKTTLIENGNFTPATTVTTRMQQVMDKKIRWGIHYNIDTYAGECFNSPKAITPPSPAKFDLKNADFSSVVKAAVEHKVDIAYINAFHETGFNLWKSDVKVSDAYFPGAGHLYGVYKQDTYSSGYNGDPDVVKKFCEAMTSEGIEPWLYVNFSAHWNLFGTMNTVPNIAGPESNLRKEWVHYICLLCQELLLKFGKSGLKGLWIDSYAVLTTAEYQKLYNAIKSIDPDCWVTQNMGATNGFHNFPADAMSYEGYVIFDHPDVDQWKNIDTVVNGVTYKIPKEFIVSLNIHQGAPHNWYNYDQLVDIPPVKDNKYWQNQQLRPKVLHGDQSFYTPTATLQQVYNTAKQYNVGFMTSPSLDRRGQIMDEQLVQLKGVNYN
ncbi:hypothetical protein CMU02_08830 [Elizabethkingia anophelis]|uniref:hypothetical protein n=1 Tax=Elizabethkingia anophelis TaxID=1117645 RepID=UPI00293CB411|nr:hypothetical protein [Elizabethkingia anophelis]MDV3904915.1 hypothetical protein [Elizabethkingia anophelis]